MTGTHLWQDDIQLPSAPFEHVVMEGDSAFAPTSPRKSPGRSLHTFTFESRFHECATTLSIHDGHYLRARCIRPGGRSLAYEVDLRFADPSPVRVHRTSWPWLAAATGFAVLAGLAAWMGPSLDSRPGNLNLLIATLASAACLVSLLTTARRTTESLELRSAHGRVTLVSLTGGIGRTRRARGFLAEVAFHVESARRAQAQDAPAFLCDELREHRRLHEVGVLSNAEYAVSKARILAAH
jgi:hypothetical protein